MIIISKRLETSAKIQTFGYYVTEAMRWYLCCGVTPKENFCFCKKMRLAQADEKYCHSAFLKYLENPGDDLRGYGYGGDGEGTKLF